MMITWVTMAEAVKSVVEYGVRYKQPLNKKAYGSATEFKTCGWKERTIYIHRVKLKELIPGRGYGIVFFFLVFSMIYFCHKRPACCRDTIVKPLAIRAAVFNWVSNVILGFFVFTELRFVIG